MAAAPFHHCEVLASPWPGVFAAAVRSERHYGRHSHGTFGFGVVDAGAHRSCSGRGTVDAYAGQVVTTNPGEVHDGRPLGGPSRAWRTVYVEPPLLAAMDPAHDDEVAITRPVLEDAALQLAIRRLLAALHGWRVGGVDALACEEALVHACGLLLARHSTRTMRLAGPTPALAAVRQRLADALLAPPTLVELAHQAGTSRFQLLRRFTATYGCTPYAWLQQQRAERARGLIGQGTRLADAAAATGFADQSHMTRTFVRQFGFTPGAWQRAVRRPQ
ncbi:MAG TPA: AraC family transcriptional regulator [Ramlibacter sp.]|nr:AraC family transcriptional regulator [Ramlibacter sp.]